MGHLRVFEYASSCSRQIKEFMQKPYIKDLDIGLQEPELYKVLEDVLTRSRPEQHHQSAAGVTATSPRKHTAVKQQEQGKKRKMNKPSSSFSLLSFFDSFTLAQSSPYRSQAPNPCYSALCVVDTACIVLSLHKPSSKPLLPCSLYLQQRWWELLQNGRAQ
jgi:hypothetical protein